LFEALVGDELEQQPPAERGHESLLHAERCDQAEPTADARGSPTAVSGDDARLQDRHADQGLIPHVGQVGSPVRIRQSPRTVNRPALGLVLQL
jgi:hypothetical protein